MNNIIKISMLMVVALMFLAACQTKENITGPESRIKLSNNESQSVEMAFHMVNNNTTSPIQLPIFTNKNMEAGYLMVANDQKSLYVTYYIFDNWQLTQAFLNVSSSVEGIPRDGVGIIAPKEFKYQSTLNRCETVFSQVIPLVDLNLHPGDNFVIASQAVVGSKSSNTHMSNPIINICVPGKADAEWWYIGQGKLSENLNRPDRQQRLTLTELAFQPMEH